MSPLKNKAQLLEELNLVVANLIVFFENCRQDSQIYELWKMSDILKHITFWHEYYKRTLESLIQKQKPVLFTGRYTELNANGVKAMHEFSDTELIQKLLAAQSRIQEILTKHNFRRIPYKQGARDYSTKEFIKIIESHIRSHLSDLQKIERRQRMLR